MANDSDAIDLMNENTRLKAKLAKVIHYHEALLMTLRASNHYWIKGVYKNASAAWKNLKASE